MATSVLPTSPVPLDTIPISPEDGSGDAQTLTNTLPPNGEAVTVFHDPDNFTVKLPLASKWTLWFTKPPSGKVRFLLQTADVYIKLSDAGRQLERSAERGNQFRLCRRVLGCLRKLKR